MGKDKGKKASAESDAEALGAATVAAACGAAPKRRKVATPATFHRPRPLDDRAIDGDNDLSGGGPSKLPKPPPPADEGPAPPTDAATSDDADSSGGDIPPPVQASFRTASKPKGPGKTNRSGLKAQEAQELRRTAAAMRACTSPEKFAREYVWKMDPQEPDVSAAAALVHTSSSDNVKMDYIIKMVQRADKAQKFWWQAYSVALHIGMIWFGSAHCSSTNTEDESDHPINAGRTRWHLVFIAAAIELKLCGDDKYHDFVGRVWDITMKDFVVHSTAWNIRTGGFLKGDGMSALPEHYSQFGPCEHDLHSAMPKTCKTAEHVIAIRMRMNANTQRKLYWEHCVNWMGKTLVKGDLEVVSGASHEGMLQHFLGTERHGPWRNDGAIQCCGGHKISHSVPLHAAQTAFLVGIDLVVFDASKIVCVCVCCAVQYADEAPCSRVPNSLTHNQQIRRKGRRSAHGSDQGREHPRCL